MNNNLQFPTEEVSLPSKGKFYPADSPLRKGVVEMKYMTAKEEDILTNLNYLQNGTAIEKLLKSLIVTKGVDTEDLLVGDKNALIIAARILGYGSEYEFEYGGVMEKVDLSSIKEAPLHPAYEEATENRFSFTLPASGTQLEFKLLTGKDQIAIQEEIKGLQKINNEDSPDNVVTFKHQILSVDGDSTDKTIHNFANNFFLARDARAFRKYVTEVQPDVDLTFYPENGPKGGVKIPIGIGFFWPDSEL